MQLLSDLIQLHLFTIFIPPIQSHGRSSAKPSPVRTCLAYAKKKKADKVSSCGYEKSTVASRSRAPSPYTHRKMCQLSEEAIQRLSHLKLGPYTFQKETAPQAPFVVGDINWVVFIELNFFLFSFLISCCKDMTH